MRGNAARNASHLKVYQFKKGGAPGPGRPKLTDEEVEARRLAREYTPRGVLAMIDMVEARDKGSAKAFDLLLKLTNAPVSSQEREDEELGALTEDVVQRLERIAKQARAKLDGHPDCA